jgi:hypothetical protein
MRKCANIYSQKRRPLVIYDFATSPFWISLYIRKILFYFLSVWKGILDKFLCGINCVPGMEVPVVGHDEAGGQDDHNQDQQIQAQEHLLHSWSRKI